MGSLPKPEIVRCYFDSGTLPSVPAMELRWDSERGSSAERVWHLPNNVVLKREAPRRFGITIHRLDANHYQTRVLWDELTLTWRRLTRNQILASSLTPLLESLGTKIWHLLDQPADNSNTHAA